MSNILQASRMHVSYGKIEAVRGIDLRIAKGQIVALIGANGAGKSSLLNALMGTIKCSGDIVYQGESTTRWPIERRVQNGLCLVPERRELFGDMTVRDNIDLGAFCWRNSRDGQTEKDREWVLGLFPRLRERLSQRAATLSGGEQQMLALARAVMSRPQLLMLDEPSLGLAPIIVREIFRTLSGLRERGMSLIVVEQNARIALQAADYCYVIENGLVTLEGSASQLIQDPRITAAYLGG